MIDVLQVNKLYHPHVGGIERVVQLLAEGFAAGAGAVSPAAGPQAGGTEAGRAEAGGAEAATGDTSATQATATGDAYATQIVSGQDAAMPSSSRPGICARVLVCNEGPRTVRETVNGVEVERVGSLGRLMSEPIAPAFPRRLRRARADIYHFHDPFPLGEAAALSLGAEARMVTTYHSDVVRQRRFLRVYGPVLRRFLERCRVIMVSSPQLVRGSPFLSPLAERCRVVRFGIDASRFEADARTAVLAAEIRERHARGGDLVLFVGRLVYYKGVECLIEAMAEVGASLLLLGDGPLRGKLEGMARELGLRDRVHVVPWAEDADMPAYYHACDLLVLPSIARSEAFGLVILEALACGKPVVSTELGTGTSFANLDGETGLVVPPGDASALAAAIRRLLADPALREEMGARGRERVEREFSLSGMIEAVAEIYAEVMRGDGN